VHDVHREHESIQAVAKHSVAGSLKGLAGSLRTTPDPAGYGLLDNTIFLGRLVIIVQMDLGATIAAA
jgi:hypothetical protein